MDGAREDSSLSGQGLSRIRAKLQDRLAKALGFGGADAVDLKQLLGIYGP